MESRAAGPRFMLFGEEWVINLQVHDYLFALKECDSCSVDPRFEVPPTESFTLALWQGPVIVVYSDWAVVQVHVNMVGVERRLKRLIYSLFISYWDLRYFSHFCHNILN